MESRTRRVIDDHRRDPWLDPLPVHVEEVKREKRQRGPGARARARAACRVGAGLPVSSRAAVAHAHGQRLHSMCKRHVVN